MSCSPPQGDGADSLAPGVVGDMRTEQMKREREYEAKLRSSAGLPDMLARKAESSKGKQHLASTIAEVVETAKKSAYGAYQTALLQEQQLEAETTSSSRRHGPELGGGRVQQPGRRDQDPARDLLNELMRSIRKTTCRRALQDTRDSNVHIVDHAWCPAAPSSPRCARTSPTACSWDS